MRSMSKKSKTARAVGLALMLAVALTLGACTVKPDSTVQDPLTDQVVTLPFDSTATPVPTAAPTSTPAGVTITRSPTASPAPTATPSPVPTIKPTAAGNWQDWSDDSGIVVPTATVAAPNPAAPTATPYATPSSFTTLKQGMKSTEVEDMQRALYQLGYYNGAIDGSFGNGTKTAVTAFQKANGLTSDGIAGSKTLSLLYSVVAPSNGSGGIVTAVPNVTAKPASPTPKPTEAPATGPSTYRILGVGSTGTDVKQLQTRLKQLGYYTGSISGTYDSATSYAVTAFQQDNKLWVDGKAGADTQKVIYGSNVAKPSNTASAYRTLRSGMTGDDVYKLQQYLIDKGYMAGSITGYYNQATVDAVRTFQQRNGLSADGIAGVATQQKLFSPNAIPAVNVDQLFPNGSVPTESTVAADSQVPTPTAIASAASDIKSDSKSDTKSASGSTPLATASPPGADPTTVSDVTDPSGVITTITPDLAGNNLDIGVSPTPEFDITITADGGINGTLKPGMNGEGVKLLQARLRELEYYLGPIDGNYSDSLTAAVRRFQTRNLMASDGIAGSGTQRMMFSDDALPSQVDMTPNVGSMQFGDRSDDVMMLQERLIRMGYLSEGATGYYGQATRDAVFAFQQMNDLPADGLAGAQTLSLLFSDVALSAAGTQGTLPPEPDTPPTPSAPTTPAPTSDVTLREGDSGSVVIALKEALVRLGYMDGPADGAFDAATTAAIKRFQAQNDLQMDGIATAATQSRLFSSSALPWPTLPSGNPQLSILDNKGLEQRETQATGTTQTNLSSGGIAAVGSNGAIYYADGSTGGQLYSLTGQTGASAVGTDRARFIHVIGNVLVYATDNEIVRYALSNGRREVVVETGLIKKLAALGDSYYYLEGGTLFRYRAGDGKRELAGNVNDFYLDVANNVLYIATSQDIRRLDGAGNPLSTVVQSGAQQVLLCDGVLYYRRDGSVFRIDSGRDAVVVSGGVNWFGFYRKSMFYITGSALAVADTNGANAKPFDMGPVASVSFINGEAYIGSVTGGGYDRKLPTP
ncbi:hypothetical protein AGMMS49992_30120 [Clostridia bacterium]|nr:hypothetical protein AGMMS49992_30120 [Clostridia bacterium]